MSLSDKLGGWHNRVAATWPDVVKELRRAAASPKTGYATLVPYAAELLPAVVVHPDQVRGKLGTLAAAVDRAVARRAAEMPPDRAIPAAFLELLDVANALECVGCPLADASHETFRDWLARMELSRDDPQPFHLWSAGFAALALGERATYRRLAARAGEATLSFIAGQTYGFNLQALLGHLAAAVENRAPAAAVMPAWEELLRNYEALYDVASLRLGTVLWTARVVHHRIGGAPVGEVAQRLRDDLGRLAGAS